MGSLEHLGLAAWFLLVDWASGLASAEVENLKAGYADAARDVLKGINLTFDARSKAGLGF